MVLTREPRIVKHKTFLDANCARIDALQFDIHNHY